METKTATAEQRTAPQPQVPAICEHIKDNGFRCGSPALRGRHFCYFHSRAHHPVGRFGRRNYRSPIVDTIESLQIATTHVMQALATGDVPTKQANSMLYAISLAGNFLRAPRTKSNLAAPSSPAVGEGEISTNCPVTEIPEAMRQILTTGPDGSPIEENSRPENRPQPAPRLQSTSHLPPLPRSEWIDSNKLRAQVLNNKDFDRIVTLCSGESDTPERRDAIKRLAEHRHALSKLGETGLIPTGLD